MEDTIAAVSTPIGQGGIAIVRMSGPQSIKVADKIFYSNKGKPSSFPTHTIHHGRIIDNGVVVDEVLLSVMHAPKTYTAENTIEINCHGGVINARSVLGACLRNGARVAEPGEFTKRAFLNGKMDLSQAESVMDVISSQTALSHAAAINMLSGKLTHKVKQLTDNLVTILAHLEAHIDFPEEDITPDTVDNIHKGLVNLSSDIQNLLSTARDGKVLWQGVRIAIVGRPNVGKSSLLNALLCEDRAIVTPHPGTTRDTLEEVADIKGVPVHFTDTAGIRKARSKIELMGIERSYKALIESDIAIFILDSSRSFSSEDLDISDGLDMDKTICVVNKTDMPTKLILPETFRHNRQIPISIKGGNGLDQLKNEIEKRIWNGVQPKSEHLLALNERQFQALNNALESINSAIRALHGRCPIELIAQDLKICLNALGELVGATTTEDILDRIFSSFCIGK